MNKRVNRRGSVAVVVLAGSVAADPEQLALEGQVIG
jgi:hypothetical protein